MVKKIFIIIALSVSISVGIFAQQIERITIIELGPLGGALRTITVNAVRLGSGQQNISLEGNFQVTYEAALDIDTGRWTDWQHMGREPARFSTLRQIYDALQRDYLTFPNGTRLLYIDGLQAFRLAAIPRGRSSPIWWAEDGRSINIFYDFYMIVPDASQMPEVQDDSSSRQPRTPSNAPKTSQAQASSTSTQSRTTSNSAGFLFGYNYENNMPIGLTLGIFDEGIGLYVSFNVGPYLSGDSDIDETRIQMEWIIGYSFQLNKYFNILAGLGANHIVLPNDELEHRFSMEGGLRVMLGIIYLSTTYRLTDFSRSGFTIGGGFILK